MGIYKKIGNFDKNVNVPKSKQNINSWNRPVQKPQLTPRLLRKKTGKPVPIKNDRPNYRRSIPRMRVLKKQYSKRRKKRQFEETDFLTFWSDLFNFANLGPGAYFDDTTYTGGAGLNVLGTLAITGSVSGAMMA